MAMQEETPAVPPSAQDVGNAFVEQYYHILHESPEQVYRFYQDSSVLSRPDPNGVMTYVMTMQGINEKILSLNYKDYIAEIKTADAQHSFGEGVVVLVTGYLTGMDNVRKKFVQSFFLAPQEKGYYVLNDVFRYMEDDPIEPTHVPVNVISENVREATPPPEPEQLSQVPDNPSQAPEPSLEEEHKNEPEVCDPSDNGDVPITEEEIVDVQAAPAELNQSETANVTSVPPPVAPSQEDAPKMSYASILKAMSTNPSAKAPANNIKARPPSSGGKPASGIQASASTSKSTPEKTIVDEGYSIYVRNLPQNATATQLEEVFKTYGPIKKGGVQVRSNKQGFCFGFVEFESLSSMRSAIEASPIVIGNRKAVIEEKRTTTRVSGPLNSSNSGRGRYPTARGGFRNESFRGGRGGNFGRGYGRGDFSNRPSRGPPGTGRGSETYQRVDHNANANANATVRQPGPK